MPCRGIRGATGVDANDAHAIIAATRELLERIVAANDLLVEDVGSMIFTATPDLDAAYPARAAREMGWVNVPLLCMQEMMVVDSLPICFGIPEQAILIIYTAVGVSLATTMIIMRALHLMILLFTGRQNLLCQRI